MRQLALSVISVALIVGKPQGFVLTMPTQFLMVLLSSGCGGQIFTMGSMFSSSMKEKHTGSLRGGGSGGRPDAPISLNQLDPNWWKATTSTPAPPQSTNGTAGVSQAGAGQATTTTLPGLDAMGNLKAMFNDSLEAYMCTEITSVPDSFSAQPAFWSEECKRIPDDAKYIKIDMGILSDYFKPIAGATFCDMLTSSNKHQWSKDGNKWVTPTYASSGLGGSSQGWPATQDPHDKRFGLPFWGVQSGTSAGGCCAHDQTETTATWNHSFKMSHCGTPKKLSPICSPFFSNPLPTGLVTTYDAYAEPCKKVSITAAYVKIVMKDCIHYIRPAPGSTYCDMLSNPVKDGKLEYSANGENWTTPAASEFPNEANANYMGSSTDLIGVGATCLFPGLVTDQGVLGQYAAGTTATANAEMTMSYCEIPQLPPLANMVTSMQLASNSVHLLEKLMNNLHNRMLAAEKMSVDAAGNVSLAQTGMNKLESKFKDEKGIVDTITKTYKLSQTRLDDMTTELTSANDRLTKSASNLQSAADVANKTASPTALTNLDDLQTQMWDLVDPNNEDSLDKIESRISDAKTAADKFKDDLDEDVRNVMVTKMRRKVQKFRKAIKKLGDIANHQENSRLGELEESKLGDDIGFDHVTNDLETQ
jgi:hypothetical protein